MQGNAVINDITAAELAKILTTPNEKGVVELDKDYDVITDWTSLTSLPVSSEEVYTLNGNGHTITGLTMPLFGYNPAKGVVINDLTIADSDIGSNKYDAQKGNNDYHSGAFIVGMDNGCVKGLSLTNCNTNNVNVTASDGSASSAGSLVGFLGINGAGVSFTNCTVTNGSVKNAYGNAAGIVGYFQTNTSHNYKIENCTVSGCKIVGEKAEKTGEIVGTVTGEALYINDCTYTCNAYGRVYVGGMAVIDGVPHVTTLTQFSAAVNNTEYSKIVLAHDITNTWGQPYSKIFQFEITKNLTIDLTGNVFNTRLDLFNVKNNANLTLMSSVEGGKFFVDSNQGGPLTLIQVENGGKLNIENGVEIDISTQFTQYYAPYAINNYGTVIMNGGKITVRNGVAVQGSGDFNYTMNGGEIVLMSDLRDIDTFNNDYATGISGDYNSAAKINLNGGKIIGKGKAYETYSNETVTKNTSFIIDVENID